ncbi:MAG: nuclear transport factor 2 family protein [Parasporobacterium sp.]|nr:nuclear transport factor 2 family protein [Parasporobacterium sp.]
MKKVKLLIVLACVCAMIFSFGSTAFAAEAREPDLATVYAMAQKALDQQAIQNVMSRHVMYHCYGLHQEEVEQLWVNEPENRETASFGQNQGFMVGWQAIWDGYVVSHTSSWLSKAKNYCEQKGIDISGMTDEEILDMYGGVGQFLMHFTTTQIIEVAKDGKTAKCFWYSPGMVAETGDAAQSLWEAYCVDMVKEGDEWKIWHLHMYTDFAGSFWIDLGGGREMDFAAMEGESDGESAEGESDGESADSSSGDAAEAEEASTGPVEEGARIAQKANDYLWSPQYTMFSKDRLRSEMELTIPVPYDTWSFDEPNYGPTREEWESYGVDLDAWYAAHAS